ncbi:MAG: nuclear transport factor 2 family protein [Pseudomonadota bacterium]|nr:nuclear transport factor 2 family protein [Pseudomonadota bacterium]
MQRTSFIMLTLTVLALFGGAASADTTADLIALDNQWGAAGIKGDSVAAGKLLADTLVSVDESGVKDKKGDLAGMTAAPAGTQYEPTDFKVTLLDADTAIMTHSTKGYQAHYSLHVWSRKGGQWKVVATSSTPIKSK